MNQHLGLARSLALRYRGRGEAMDDLMQVAMVGLVAAAGRFDPDRGVAFSSFAVPTILGELRRHFRDHGWGVRPPRRLQELAGRVRRVRDELTQRFGRSPTVLEIAEALDVEVDEVLEAVHAARSYTPVRLQQEHRRLAAADGDPAEVVVDRTFLVGLLRSTPDRERTIVWLKVVEGLTQTEIGDHIGISQMHVSRLLHRTIQQLRDSAAT